MCSYVWFCVFFNAPATTEIYTYGHTLSLHAALPIYPGAEFVWVLDPIDGTKRFITGNPLFGSLVALLQGGRPILGVIDMPILEERWVGAAGHPTTFTDRNGTRTAQIGRAHV